ncbi:MAG: dTMP kinase [Candidatus Saccharimonas sp.]
MHRGKYIIIEGQDGTGKTTQADLLQKHLEKLGVKAIHIKEPGGSPVTEAIRGVLLDSTLERTPMTNALLFTAIRHELWHAVIKPALDAGTWVICTRNYISTLAYQGYGEGMSLSVIRAITDTFTSKRYMNPDFSVMLAFDNVEARRQRIAERGELTQPDTFESKEVTFQETVQNAYHTIARDLNIPIVQADQSISEIHAEIMQLMDKEFSRSTTAK